MKIRPFIKEDIKSVSELLSYRHRKERKFLKGYWNNDTMG